MTTIPRRCEIRRERHLISGKCRFHISLPWQDGFSLVSKAYLNADEALLHDSQNAERMRVDGGIMESLEARQRAVALLNWHFEPENAKSFQQKELTEQLTLILQRTPRFLEMRLNLLKATWYGRYGIALQYSSQIIGGQRPFLPHPVLNNNDDSMRYRFSCLSLHGRRSFDG